MGRTLWENWVLGPHDPEARSPVGAFFWWLVCSDAWEFVFLSYILFNAVLKMTDLRIQVLPVRLVTLAGSIFTGSHLDGRQPR